VGVVIPLTSTGKLRVSTHLGWLSIRSVRAGYDDAAASAGVKVELKMTILTMAAPSVPARFFGVTWRQIYINSDGNLTFSAAIYRIERPVAGALHLGPPRIAPLFSDLDPSRSQRGVVVTAEATRFVVTWRRAGLQRYTGEKTGTAVHNLSVRLLPDGHIEMAWNGISAADAWLGLRRVICAAGSSVISFTAGSAQRIHGGGGERFSGTESIDIVTAARSSTQTHEDAYDYLVIYKR